MQHTWRGRWAYAACGQSPHRASNARFGDSSFPGTSRWDWGVHPLDSDLKFLFESSSPLFRLFIIFVRRVAAATISVRNRGRSASWATSPPVGARASELRFKQTERVGPQNCWHGLGTRPSKYPRSRCRDKITYQMSGMRRQTRVAITNNT